MDYRHDTLSLDYQGEEGFLNTCLQHWLKVTPQAGQNFVDTLCLLANKESLNFIDIVCQKRFSLTEAFKSKPFRPKIKPDLYIRCEEADIIVEHKLDGRFRDCQMERYLEVAQEQVKKTYLACISQRMQSISSELLNSSLYLYPVGQKHFVWKDFCHVFLISSHLGNFGMTFTMRNVETHDRT